MAEGTLYVDKGITSFLNVLKLTNPLIRFLVLKNASNANVCRPSLGPWGLPGGQAGSASSPGIVIMPCGIWEFRHLGRLLREKSL